MNISSRTSLLVALLLMIGLGGALVSSSVLSAATLMLSVIGIILIARQSLQKTGWEPPRELRLIHFAFWFYVSVSAYSWAVEGFDYEGGKTLGTHARFILFWPLVMALSHARLRAITGFAAIGLISLSVIGALIYALQPGAATPTGTLSSRFGGGINPISFGNIALLGGMLTLVGGLFFLRNGNRFLAMAFIAGSVAAVLTSLLSETRSNLLALPFLLLIVIPLLGRKLRLAAVLLIPILVLSAVFSTDRTLQSIDAALNDHSLDSGIELRLELWNHAWEMFVENPWTGAGLGGFSHTIRSAVDNGSASPALLDCCVGHAHNDLINNAATSGIPGVLSWAFLIFIPLAIFSQHVRSKHFPTAHIAAAGTMVTVGYFFFGLTEATFNRSLFLTFYLLIISVLATTLFHELKASCVRKRGCRVSTTVITMNEEDHIADCLVSARQVSDEIIVLDSGSSDRTVEIARQYADMVETTDWPGFGVQKQRALERATGDWVLSLDADERITEELAREINHRLAAPDADAYKLPWAVTIYGKRLDFGRSGRAPLRLFRREGVSFSDALVHERILIPEGRSIKTLRGRLTHYTHRDFGHSLEKSAKYAWLGSREKHRRGKRTRTMLYPTLRAVMTFIQVYFIRFGFLDGSVGYLTAVTYAQVTFNKYAGLWTLSRNKHPVE